MSKCAVGIIDSNGICYNVKLIEKLVHAYNKANPDKPIIINPDLQRMKEFNIIGYKKRLYDLLKEKTNCTTGEEWLKLPFLKYLAKNDFIEARLFTFKPVGPIDYTWLNNFDITRVMYQYERVYKTFKFLGAYPRDFDSIPNLALSTLDWQKFIDENKTKLGFIFNHDVSTGPGIHWVSMYVDLLKKQIYYFDSVGKPPKKEVWKLINSIKNFLKTPLIKINTVQHQYSDTECGIYAITFIIRLLDGETCNEIFNEPVSDYEIHKLRKKYFNGNKQITEHDHSVMGK